MKLKDWRTRENLSLAAFGKLIGRSHVSVLRIERGDNSPDTETMQAIYEATAGEVTLHDFFTEDGKPVPQSDEASAA